MSETGSSLPDCFLLLNDPVKIAESTDVELSTSISNIFSLMPSQHPHQQQQFRSTTSTTSNNNNNNIAATLSSFPNITIETVLILIKRFAAEEDDGHLDSTKSNETEQQKHQQHTRSSIGSEVAVTQQQQKQLQQQPQQNDPVSFFCLEQLKVLIAMYFSTAAKYSGNLALVDTWFTNSGKENNNNNNNNNNAVSLNTIVCLLLKTLSQESHSLVSGEMLRLFLQCSPTFLKAFVLYSSSSTTSNNNNDNSNKPLFEETSLGIIAPMLTENSALKNHSAWQVMFAVLENDIHSARPSRFVVEYLSKNHLHSFLNVLITCLRHSNPASRRFTLRFVSDMFQAFGDWSPISHCVLQSPAIFFALLANAEGTACPEHWQVYHIVKMFITFPNKCPLMRHLCYINRDALGQYAQSCAVKFSVHQGETTTIIAKLAAMTPLTGEEAALIQVGL